MVSELYAPAQSAVIVLTPNVPIKIDVGSNWQFKATMLQNVFSQVNFFLSPLRYLVYCMFY